MSPTFSVVIPTYNQAEYLKVALNSVLEQTFKDFEVIVVNNFSTDHTLDVIGLAEDSRVKVINFRNDGVIGAGRNTGIMSSRGEYVAFLDSDDTWHGNKLERIAEAMEADSQIGLVCHDQALVRDGRVTGRTHFGPPPSFRGNLYDYLLLTRNALSTSATVVARRYLDEVGNFVEDPAFITVEDYDLWLRLSKVCRFRFISEILGTHQYHTGSASARIELHLRSNLAVLDRHFAELQDSQRSHLKRPIRRRYAYAFYGAARQYHQQGFFRKSLGYYARALRTYPFGIRTYAGLAQLLADLPLGQARRMRTANASQTN